jgi:fluoride ion exporter CrcB/FEX
MNVLVIIVLGAVGGVLRSMLENTGVTSLMFLNLFGAFSLGLIAAPRCQKRLTKVLQSGLSSGFIASLTTFSSLIMSTVLLDQTNVLYGMLYLTLTLTLGLILSWAGQKVGALIYEHTSENDHTRNQGDSEYKPRDVTSPVQSAMKPVRYGDSQN